MKKYKGGPLPSAARSIQFVHFVDNGKETDARSIFTLAFGEEPDNLHTYLKPFGPQEVWGSANGLRDGLERIVTVQSSRIDIFMRVVPGPESTVIENVEDEIPKIAKALQGMPSPIKGVSRLAVVVDFIQRFDSLDDTNAAIRDRLGTAFPGANQSDFLLQLNVTKVSNVRNHTLNRLVKWTCENVQEFAFQAQPGQTMVKLDASNAVRSFYIFSQLIDVNTVPVAGVDPADQAKLLTEMVAECTWLRTNGKLDRWA
ncbi:hypothetical protein [Mesorhizobium shangrilense]|uniref:TIGR04255 family protein n=1 Tax=Mesorhizobium shangrilense TaxID=460060 RepID=A0ABV2D8P6_9HYPH